MKRSALGANRAIALHDFLELPLRFESDSPAMTAASMAHLCIPFGEILLVRSSDPRIAACLALLSEANAFWYDHSTSSVRYEAGKLDTLTMVIQ